MKLNVLTTILFTTVLLAAPDGPSQAQEVSLDQLVGKWTFHLSWGGLVNDTGIIMARKAGNGIEMTCTDGCNTPPFLRGSTQDGRTAWEFWPAAGVQSNCPEDKGWHPVQPNISPDGRRINFWYILHISGDCSKFLRGTPEKYSLTRE